MKYYIIYWSRNNFKNLPEFLSIYSSEESNDFVSDIKNAKSFNSYEEAKEKRLNLMEEYFRITFYILIGE